MNMETQGLANAVGAPLGTRSVAYSSDDAILYALAVGAGTDSLDLIYEKNLRVLPTYATTLGLWVADAAGALGLFTPQEALHGAQELVIHEELPGSGIIEITGRVAAVWDKGQGAVLDVEATSTYFTATYSIFLPGRGGWGGPRGSSTGRASGAEPTWTGSLETWAAQPALYRLTGDKHLIHIDPDGARAAGLAGVIMHGLCTFGSAARELAAATGAHAADLRQIRARFAAPVIPGDDVALAAWATSTSEVEFTAHSNGSTVLTGGYAHFQRGDT